MISKRNTKNSQYMVQHPLGWYRGLWYCCKFATHRA